MNNFLNTLFNNIASKTVISLFGLIAAGITIFVFLQEKKVELRYEIIANTNVLDFNAEISKLEVIYDSTNLKQTKENLRIYTVKIINSGSQNLLKEFYDENDPIGIRISSGKIIERPELIQASNEYLERNVKIENYELDQISFSQVILEPGEFFLLKLLVLHRTDSIPSIYSFGKIAGQNKIAVLNAIDIKDEQAFWNKSYFGGLWVQLVRLITYFSIGVILIVIIVSFSDMIDKQREKKRKLRLVSNFKSLNTYEYTRMDDAIFDRYLNQGSLLLKRMLNLINNERELNRTYNKLREQLGSKEFSLFRGFDSDTRKFQNRDDWTVINQMTNDGIIFKEHNSLRINLAMKDTLEKFVNYLTEHYEFKQTKAVRTNINERGFVENT